MGSVHTHQLRIDTEEELVTVQIGGEGSVPGGFAKLFNRVIDSEAWAHLSDAGRAAYIPMVRFADHRNQYRVQIGQAALMKYAGLSRSSIKRAIKDLLASKLLILLEQGGVTPDGRNESNLYQLMVPVDPKPRAIGGNMGYAAPVEAEPQARYHGLGVGSQTNPLATPSRTPSRFVAEPPPGPVLDPEPVLTRPAAGAHRTPVGGFTSGPQLRSNKELQDNNRVAGAPQPVVGTPSAAPTDAAVLLEEQGVERAIARQLAADHSLQRVIDVIETMQFRRARGKCENPGGFIRDALVKQWQTPRAVLDARAKAQARVRAEATQQQARQAQQSAVADVDAEQRKLDQLIDALDDDELEMLAVEVLKKYDDNSAVLSVLTRKPPRQCRLMKMEIAAMLGRK